MKIDLEYEIFCFEVWEANMEFGERQSIVCVICQVFLGIAFLSIKILSLSPISTNWRTYTSGRIQGCEILREFSPFFAVLVL